MDAAGVTILLKELEMDCAVVRDAAGKAAERIRREMPGHLEACAYELARLYDTFERMVKRICEQFENQFDKRGDYHERLLQRLSLALPGIRPAFIAQEWVGDLRELKGFRHVVRHAYDLTLRTERLAELSQVGERLAAQLPVWCVDFGERVRSEQGWEP